MWEFSHFFCVNTPFNVDILAGLRVDLGDEIPLSPLKFLTRADSAVLGSNFGGTIIFIKHAHSCGKTYMMKAHVITGRGITHLIFQD